ncbi:MAG: Mth938-like domain-containing protein, partial [Wolbachia sp.]
MDIIPLVSMNKNFIGGYWKGKFLVNDQEYHGSIIIFPKKVVELKESDINSKEHFQSLLTEEIEILIIGTGKTRNALDSSVKSYLMEQKDFSFEFMTTGS